MLKPNRSKSALLVFYYLPINHLLIITIPDLEFLAVPTQLCFTRCLIVCLSIIY